MKIMICSLQDLAKHIDYAKRANLNIISIRDASPNKLNKDLYSIIDDAGLENILVIQFDDLLAPIGGGWAKHYTEKPPSEEDITTILEWAKQKMSNGKTFVVQCTAGISRSSAVAVLIKCLENPAEALKVINPIIHSPNRLVLELGEKILNRQNLAAEAKELEKKYNEQFLKNFEEKAQQREEKGEKFNYQKDDSVL
jgi:predicted protein tyrosine phosphatase